MVRSLVDGKRFFISTVVCEYIFTQNDSTLLSTKLFLTNMRYVLPGRSSSTAGGIEVCALSTFRFNHFKIIVKNNYE